MKTLLSFLVVFFLVTAIRAQAPYALFNSKSELFFSQSGNNDELLGLKTDSTKILGTDSVYYHYRILASRNGLCNYSAQMPSWLGFKTILTANNNYVFFNMQNDSLILKPGNAVGTSWDFYKYPNGDYIQATIASKQYESTFDGQFDSVKTISFQAYNNSNVAISNDYNTKVYKIAKNQGIIKLGNMFKFPADTSIKSRCFGKRLTIFDLCDHNVGDMLETNGYTTYYMQNAAYSQTYRMYTFLSKTNPAPDSVIYTVSATVQTNSVYPTSATAISTSTQTLNIGHLDSLVVKQMPGQFLMLGSQGSIYGTHVNYYYNATSSSCTDKFRITYIDCISLVGNSDTCLNPSVSCPEPVLKTFIKGMDIGPDGYKQSMMTFPNSGAPNFNHYPIYSNNLNNNCGSIVILGIEENSNKRTFHPYPNPVSKVLVVDLGLEYTISGIQITDVLGKEMICEVYGNANVDVSSLQNGVYFVHVKTEKGYYSGKFIKD